MANALYTIKVEGLRELIARGDNAVNKDMRKLVRGGLRKAAEPARREAARLFTKYDRESAARFAVTVRKTGVVNVEQRLRRTTGLRPDFGRLQIRKALLPGFQNTYPEVVSSMQRQVDEIGRAFVEGGG